jgi:hypothetical protein
MRVVYNKIHMKSQSVYSKLIHIILLTDLKDFRHVSVTMNTRLVMHNKIIAI